MRSYFRELQGRRIPDRDEVRAIWSLVNLDEVLLSTFQVGILDRGQRVKEVVAFPSGRFGNISGLDGSNLTLKSCGDPSRHIVFHVLPTIVAGHVGAKLMPISTFACE